jgi:hypothetical protein
VATDALSAAITNSLSIDVMAAATHPYRVPLREGDPLYPPLSERLPVEGLIASTLCLAQLSGSEAALSGLPPHPTVAGKTRLKVIECVESAPRPRPSSEQGFLKLKATETY